MRTVPNLSVENAQRKHVRSCVDCTHTQGDRESGRVRAKAKQSKSKIIAGELSLEYFESHTENVENEKRPSERQIRSGIHLSLLLLYVCVLLFFSIFFVCSPFFHSRSRCTNHCSDCFDRNSKRRQTEKMYSGKNVQQNETTKDQCEHYSSSSYTVKNRLSFMRRMCDVCSWCSRVVSNAVVLVARTVSLSHSTVQCAVRHMQKGNPTERSFAAASAHQMF